MCEIQLPYFYFLFVIMFGGEPDSCSEEYQRLEMTVAAYVEGAERLAQQSQPEKEYTINDDVVSEQELSERFRRALNISDQITPDQ